MIIDGIDMKTGKPAKRKKKDTRPKAKSLKKSSYKPKPNELVS